MKKNVLIILLSIFFLSCNKDDNNSEMTNVESTLIAEGDLGGSGNEGIVKQNSVITDQNTWNDLITQMDSVNNQSDNFSEIDIDFSAYIVIAVFDEIKGLGGHILELSVNSNSENIIVSITYLSPEVGPTIMNQPYHIVKIPTSDLPVIFE